MKSIFSKFFDPNKRAINKVIPQVEEILASEDKYKDMPLVEMQKKVVEIREELKPLIDKIPREARYTLAREDAARYKQEEEDVKQKLLEYTTDFFAIMREINRRKFGKPHYKVQLTASFILAQGHSLTELKTGEGKTQVFHLPAALYGLTSRGSHVITVNDYLARRDGEYAGHAMADLGITVGIITPQASYRFVPDNELLAVKGEETKAERDSLDIALLSNMKGVNLVECTKREAYAQDVVYGTNNEFGFDYLRDNMSYNIKDRVQTELYFCIIDEADSILIDEARTPLIISQPAGASNDLYAQFAKIAKRLDEEKHYTVDEKTRSVTLTEGGVDFVEEILGLSNIWENYQIAHHLDNALKAEVLYKINDEYIVKNGEVLIVDEFTGRVLPGRRYSEGIHQAIEAKEGVEIKRESKTLATITFQNFFKLYKILSGGSGTIMTEAGEFYSIYNLDSFQIPTNKPVIREDRTEKVYKDKNTKYKAVVQEIKNVHEKGQPILVGTTTIEESEYLSRQLDKVGIVHEVLNAKFHEREAQIVAKAGDKSAVTVATNMAGRGTDIPLQDEVLELGGLYIIGTQRHEARRIDNQLRGRAGRQGQPGVSQFYVALDDEIMRIQGGEVVKRIMEATNIPDDMPIESRVIGRSIETAQKRMEGSHFDTRKRVVDYDNVMNQQREIFYTKRFNIISLGEKAEEEETKAEALANIKEELSQKFSEEVEAIIRMHFLPERKDSKDIENIVKDFADLANDKYIFDTASKILDKKINSINDLIEAIKELKQIDDIAKALTDITITMLDNKLRDFGEEMPQIYKIATLQIMDELWTEHLDQIADLREGVGLRAYAQRDPLVEYKNEAFTLFEDLMAKINSQLARRLLKIARIRRVEVTQEEIQTNEDQVSDVLTGSREMESTTTNKGTPTPPQIKSNISNIKRNDLCPCGSGLKYKRCGMINSAAHINNMAKLV